MARTKIALKQAIKAAEDGDNAEGETWLDDIALKQAIKAAEDGDNAEGETWLDDVIKEGKKHISFFFG
ncbi:hypothetical protein F2Q68_00006604 [Brassica cretica]|uniref:Uncharacterized protein n=1 Tax=Brassica cretica TaxID=69181 RepID=A0A8S9J7V3_BRACR|nr:hypothetical protein F2Q68_00006604 [Brassica cretica]